MVATRPFGRHTATTVSEVGLGTWQLGGTEWGTLSDEQALAVLRAAVDSRITLLDTADIYGGGRSETLIGRFVGDLPPRDRDSLHIATKLGRRHDPPNGWPANFTAAAIRAHTQDSLRRLRVDRLFLQQLHCIPTEVLAAGDVFGTLDDLRREGLIAHWGVSVETIEEGLLCLAQPGCAALQVIFNVFRHKPLESLFPLAHSRGVAILARVPLASGVLSGRFGAGHRFAASDHRHFNADGQAFNVGETFAGVAFDRAVTLAEKFRALVDTPPTGATLAELALRWVLDCPFVTAVIPGATRPEQVTANARASRLAPLTAAQHQALRELYSLEIAPHIRGRY